jgi:anti-sigma factor RsiW
MITECREISSLVTEYLEGTMPLDQRADFERHVAVCPPCRGHLRQMRVLLRAAGGLRDEALPAELRAALLDHFERWRREARA